LLLVSFTLMQSIDAACLVERQDDVPFQAEYL